MTPASAPSAFNELFTLIAPMTKLPAWRDRLIRNTDGWTGWSTPPGGAICGDSEYVSFDGIDRPHRTAAWAYPEAWPASVQLRAASRSGQTFRRFGLSDCGYRDIVGANMNRVRSSRLPVRGDDGGWNTAWFIPPRTADAALTVSASYEAAANVRVCDPGADAAEADGSSEKPYRTV